MSHKLPITLYIMHFQVNYHQDCFLFFEVLLQTILMALGALSVSKVKISLTLTKQVMATVTVTALAAQSRG